MMHSKAVDRAFRWVLLSLALSGAVAHGLQSPPASAPPPVQPQQECALDTDAYTRKARTLAARKPGGKLEEPYTASFSQPHLGRVSVTIGGCENLGLEVSASMPKPKALSRAAVMDIARRLTREYLVPVWNKDLLDVLARAPADERQDAGSVTLFFPHESYADFTVEYGYKDGIQRIAVSVIPVM